MVKVFTTNKNGKLEFTAEELEKMLKEARDEGYNEGYIAGSKSTVSHPYTVPNIDKTTTQQKPWWWDPSSPSWWEPTVYCHTEAKSATPV